MNVDHQNSPVVPKDDASSTGRRRYKTRSSSNPALRSARKTRERWMNRRQKLQQSLLVLTAAVVTLTFLAALIDVLTDNFDFSWAYNIMIGVSFFALLIWGLLRVFEWLADARYHRLSKEDKRTKKRSKRSHSTPDESLKG